MLRRTIHALGVMLGVVVIVFFAGRLLGDPVRIVAGVEASEERLEVIRESLNLDKPILIQFGIFLTNVLRGDFGNSFWQKRPVTSLVLERIPATLYLTGVALLIAVPAAILLGAMAALKPRSFADRAIRIISLGGVSVVDFWLGLMLILLFAVQLGWFKTSGYGGIQYVILPALTLAYRPLGTISQITRSAMLDELSKPYVKAARAKGLSGTRVIFDHALKNAAIPIVTIAGIALTSLLNGAIVVETVFGWPGIGLLSIQALERRDLPLIEGTVFFVALTVVVTNLAVDFAYTYLNPKIRLS
ncbi:MAG: ABC transporter permease [Chloroflexi bacterium]|nr:ABC transporter permease [Chloroflexota bacterium]